MKKYGINKSHLLKIMNIQMREAFYICLANIMF